MARSRGAPARLICLVLLALVAAVCLFATGVDARRRRGPPQPCPAGAGNVTVVCDGCIKRSCRFDDRCHWAKNLQARQTPCANVVSPRGAGVTEAQLKARNQCLGIQRKHGARAAPIVGGPGNRRVRCQATRIPQPMNKTVSCICVTKRGNPANRGCRNCIPATGLVLDPVGPVNPPPPPSPPSPPPAPPSPPAPPPTNSTCYIPGCDMVSQWGNYKPSTEGNVEKTWGMMCNFAPQAKSISYAMSQTPRTFSFAASVWDGTVGGFGGKAINEPDFSGNTYFDNAAIYSGTGTQNKKFLNAFFQAGLLGAGVGGVGTEDPAGRAEVLKKTSQDWAPVVWMMKYLDEAATKLAAGGIANQAAARLAYDYVAAAYLGCGQNNPVPLPTSPNVTYAGKTFTTGGPTLYTPAGTTQKRSSNTGQQETFNGNTNIASQAVLVVKTLNEGPTLNGINVIKDSLLTVYSQATLRYAAKLTLAAHLPGNGMGGSTKPITIAEPTISTSGVTACGVNQVGVVIGSCAATGCTAQQAGAPKNENDFDKPLCCNVAANQPANIKDAGVRPTKLSAPAGAGMGYVEWNSIGAIAEAQLKSKNAAGAAPSTTSAAGVVNAKTKAANEGLSYPAAEQLTQSAAGIVTAPASGCTNLRANAYGVGNSLATGDLSQFPVAYAAAGSTCKAAYNALTTGAATGLAPATITISSQKNARGIAGTAALPNTYCTGPSVGYLTPFYIGNNWASEPASATLAGGTVGGQFNYQTFNVPTLGGAYNTNAAGVLTQGVNPNTISAEAAAWVAGGVAGGAQRGARQGFAYATADIVSQLAPASANREWARLATFGEQVQFGPVQASPSGSNMGGEDSLACTDGGSSSGADNVNSAKTGNAAAKNGSGSQIKNQLEGLAFFQVIAGQMQQAKPANIPKDTSGNSLVGSKALENCSANLQAMFTFNTNAIVKNSNSVTVPSATSVKGNQPNAISFPTWKVAIGTKPTAADFTYYVVPNGFCYTNQCLDTYLTSVTQNKGADFGKLIKEPNMGAPSAGKTCGLANGACATLGVFRLDNVSPLTYQCSTATGAVAGIPAACGTTKWTRTAVTGATAPFGVTPYTGAGAPAGTGNTAVTDTMYINTQAAAADLPLSAAAGTITRTAWDGQEWPEPRLITGAFVGAPAI